MADNGQRYTDRRQAVLKQRLESVYKQAQKELEKKLESFVKKHEKKNEQKLKDRQDGKITEQEYKDWLAGQVFIGNQWKAKVNEAATVLLHSNEKSLTLIRDEQMNVFAENANYQAYMVESIVGSHPGTNEELKLGSVNFDIYDTATVDRLVKEKPELLPRKVVNDKKDTAWNTQIIWNTVTQGIIQGESIPQIAKRMARDVASTDMKAMVRYARTAMTGAQNAGRLDTMHRAQSMGINVKKQWLATLDRRTRDSHRHLDGQQRDIDKHFQSELGEIMYPGDPEAEPGDVYNCRCTLEYVYPDYMTGQSERGAYDEYIDKDGHAHREYFTLPDGSNYGDWLIAKKARHGQAVPQIPQKPAQKDYMPDRFDAEYERLEKRIKEVEQREKEEREKAREELMKLYQERNEYKNLMAYVSKDVSMYSAYATEEQYTAYRDSLMNEIDKLHAELDSLKRPRSSEFGSETEYDKAFEQYLTKKQELRRRVEEAETKLYNMASWQTIEKTRYAQSLGRDEITRKMQAAQERYVELDRKTYTESDELRALRDERSKYGFENVARIAKEKGIEWRTPNRNTEPFDSDKAIAKLSGADKTEGSCASLAFCYAGQMGGYDVIDYRDGDSRWLFSHHCVEILKSMREEGKAVSVESARSYTTAGKHVLKNAQEGKTYYFECGKHAAIVRVKDGDLQYLEMQSGYRPNTWYSFDQLGVDRTLKWRFGSGVRVEMSDAESYLVDLEDMSKDERFLKLLGYMNTDPTKQVKGDGGGEK